MGSDEVHSCGLLGSRDDVSWGWLAGSDVKGLVVCYVCAYIYL